MKSHQKNSLKKSEETMEVSSKKYRCEKCRDLTFILEDNIAIPCECRAIIEAENILKNSGISEEFRKKTFENFNYSSDYMKAQAYVKAKNYAHNIDEILKSNNKNNSIMFMGQVGSGKTHLSMSIANELMKKGIGVTYMPYREVITQIKQNMMDKEYYIKSVNRYKNAKILLVDDLFKGGITNSDINIIFEIINHRYFNNLPFIISTEKGKKELLEIDEAIGSRMIEMSKDYIIEMKGKKLNYRLYEQ